jgi:hypothetical protein
MEGIETSQLCKRQPNFAIFEAMELIPSDPTALLITILGWIGSVEVLLAYGLNVANRLKSNSLTYILLNLTGGIFLIIYTIYLKAFANTFINVVWAVVAVVALVKILLSKKPVDS